jgi:predicted permease
MAASMFMNSNSLPIALMQSLVVSVPGLEWGDDDNKHAMVGRALTYLVVYSTLGMIVRTYGSSYIYPANHAIYN